ncbi:hypothetical protein [Micromonospora chalcea]|uniref:hypothetical protein n=1 Tax=Micromonospora chalcea TaxID=1874 RepID=UPI003329C3E2
MIDGRILVIPWLIHSALQLRNSYLAAARLPHPANVLPPGVSDAMNKHRKDRNDELETTVRDIAADLGLPHRFEFNQGEQASLGIQNPIGEIEVLIADPVSSRLWICEVKDLATPQSVAATRHQSPDWIPDIADPLSEAALRHYAAQATEYQNTNAAFAILLVLDKTNSMPSSDCPSTGWSRRSIVVTRAWPPVVGLV